MALLKWRASTISLLDARMMVLPSGLARTTLGGDGAASAGHVVHNHRHAQAAGQRLGDRARQSVGGSTGSEAHHQGDGAVRPCGVGKQMYQLATRPPGL
jgi:hypothetical protein